nr:MAG TPA: hypothetical protein [Caudoviricetes sp.]
MHFSSYVCCNCDRRLPAVISSIEGPAPVSIKNSGTIRNAPVTPSTTLVPICLLTRCVALA